MIFLATIRVDNLTDDSIIFYIDGKEYSVAEDEKINIQNIEKGNHNLRIRRTKDRSDEVIVQQEKSTDIFDKLKGEEKSVHIQLESDFIIDINSSKSVITVKKDIIGFTKGGMDAIFSGFSIELSGAKMTEKKDYFSDKLNQKKFTLHVIKESFIPIGIISIIITIISSYSLFKNIMGDAINLGGTKFTYPFSFALLAISLFCIGYFIYSLIVGFKKKKIYMR